MLYMVYIMACFVIGSAPLQELVDSPNVKIHNLSEPFQLFTGNIPVCSVYFCVHFKAGFHIIAACLSQCTICSRNCDK